MVEYDILSLLALVISAISAAFSIWAYKNSQIYREFDYATRLELIDEEISHPFPARLLLPKSPREKDRAIPLTAISGISFTYSAKLVNHGEMPIHIDKIILAYGDFSNELLRRRRVIERSFFLSREEPHSIKWSVPTHELKEVIDLYRLDADECGFVLYVYYFTARGQYVEAVRSLGTERHFVSHMGGIIHPTRQWRKKPKRGPFSSRRYKKALKDRQRERSKSNDDSDSVQSASP